jgi:hypothetical protein
VGSANIDVMNPAVSTLPRGRKREQLLARVIEERRTKARAERRGRAWINGKEVGGPDLRYSHLSRSYD